MGFDKRLVLFPCNLKHGVGLEQGVKGFQDDRQGCIGFRGWVVEKTVEKLYPVYPGGGGNDLYERPPLLNQVPEKRGEPVPPGCEAVKGLQLFF